MGFITPLNLPSAADAGSDASDSEGASPIFTLHKAGIVSKFEGLMDADSGELTYAYDLQRCAAALGRVSPCANRACVQGRVPASFQPGKRTASASTARITQP